MKHLYHLEDIEHEIEIEEKSYRLSQSGERSVKAFETFFRYRNVKQRGFVLENYLGLGLGA